MQAHALVNYLADSLALLGTAGIILAYHLYLRSLARHRPTSVLSHVAKTARSAWVETVMSDSNSGLLAIQTLRNSTRAATFLASTAVLLMVGVLNLAGHSPDQKSNWQMLNFVGATHSEIWMAKLLSILLILFFAFFSMDNAIRVFNHVGYMINVRGSAQEPSFSAAQVAGELNRGGQYFSWGLRAYYYLVPLVFWLFGPVYMVVAAALLVVFMLPEIDLTPKQFN